MVPRQQSLVDVYGYHMLLLLFMCSQNECFLEVELSVTNRKYVINSTTVNAYEHSTL